MSMTFNLTVAVPGLDKLKNHAYCVCALGENHLEILEDGRGT